MNPWMLFGGALLVVVASYGLLQMQSYPVGIENMHVETIDHAPLTEQDVRTYMNQSGEATSITITSTEDGWEATSDIHENSHFFIYDGDQTRVEEAVMYR